MTKILLKKLTPDVICEEYLQTINDKKYMRYSRQSLIDHSKESLFKYISDTNADPTQLFWGAFEESQHVGNIGAEYDEFNKRVNISILVFKPFSKKGYGKLMFNRAISYIVTNLPVKKIEIGTMSENTGMIALAKSCGFVSDGRREKHLWDGNKLQDCVFYSKFLPK